MLLAYKIVSLNRYERKKKIELVLESVKYMLDQDESLRSSIEVIIAGGYDANVRENVEYLQVNNEITLVPQYIYAIHS